MGVKGIKITLRSADKGWNAIVQTINAIRQADAFVTVGVIDSKSPPKTGAKPRPDNAYLAAIHEFGAPGRNIPERSFIRSTFAVKKDGYTLLIAKLIKAVYGQKMTVLKALGIVGLQFSNDVKGRIRKGEIKQGLAARTIAAKRAKSYSGASKSAGKTPLALIDTGQLLNAITFEVHTGGNSVLNSGPPAPVMPKAGP